VFVLAAHEGLSSASAALIAACVAAIVAIASQFLGHELANRRDRRNQKRDRAEKVVLQAARALFSRDRMTDEEFETWSPQPGSFAATSPETVKSIVKFQQGWSEALTELQIEFGVFDPLVDAYGEAAKVCTEAITRISEILDSDVKLADETGKLTSAGEKQAERAAQATVKAQNAREQWVKQARARIDKIN
jgi:hypothetical protein